MADKPQGSDNIQQTTAQKALSAWLTETLKAQQRTRYAEEREWAQSGYFDQLKQWLDEDPQTNKLRPMNKSKKNKWPMPVTNLFSKTIASNANALGADVPEMLAYADNYDAQNRRAAEAAENCIDAANRESGMEILNPTLARRVVLWGLGCTYDTIAFDRSTVEVPVMAQPAALGAGVQAGTNSGSANQSGDVESASPQTGTGSGPGGTSASASAPQAGDAGPAAAGTEEEQEPQVTGTQAIPTARLKTYLLTPFEFYLPRWAEDANLASPQIVRWRLPLGDVKENYPQYAQYIEKDSGDNSLAQFYLNTLRSLAYQNAQQNEADQEMCTLTEVWCDWVDLPEEVRKKIAQEWQNQPSEVYEDCGFTKLQAAVEYGLCAVQWNECIIQWGENPWDGDSPLTFFPWQKDPVSVYPKGLAVELVPLVKSLNRLDSLMLRAIMSNGTVKLLWPITQTAPPPSGDPIELATWDPVGDGKVKPEYFSGRAYGPEVIALRKQIVDDINSLGFNNSVAEGEMPGSGTAFRALAYLGSKAEETRKTQRYLWEQAHELRARKLLKMARKVWTEPRKIQTAGYNNRYGSQELDASDLNGGYEIRVIQDSSRPKTQTEKLEVLQMLQQGGYVSPTDVATREYIFDTLGMTDLDMADHLQYEKAERDLEKLKQGIQPMESPFEKWQIPLMVFANYTLTEEFEALPDNVRNGILMYTQYISEKLSVAQGAPLGLPAPQPGPGPTPPGSAGPNSPEAQKGGPGGQPAHHVLGQVPGAQVSNAQVEGAAMREAANVVPNSPAPSA